MHINAVFNFWNMEIFSVFYQIKLNIFGFWITLDFEEHIFLTIFSHFIAKLSMENNCMLQPNLV